MPRPRLAWPERIPVRWRIAVTCASLTFLILIVFAGVLGNLVGDRVRDDFNDELAGAAGALAAEFDVGMDPSLGPVIDGPRIDDSAMADGAVIRIVDRAGRTLRTTNTAVELGPPHEGVSDTGLFSVASERIQDAGPLAVFVQYAEPDQDVQATIDRLWLFLAAGVLGGTVLALLAGLAVADRAMRPIAALTSLARDIATTRDPSRRMPIPAADDEIGELAETMDGMLDSLDEARTERERAFERQREFVADASHELRTPLTSVQANLELLQGSLEDPEDRHAVDSALGSTRRMSRLVSDLLLLARADAGRRSARTEADLSAVAQAVVAELEPISAGRALHTALGPELLVEGNPDELHRLALNLVENSLRYTPEGSNVHVSTRRDKDTAVLEVADDGPGIPAEIRDQVFDRFVRGEGPADTAARGGSGLGLAIVRAVADSHGGSVETDTSPHGGARFTVTIPLIQVDAADVASDVDETKPASGEPTRPAGTALSARRDAAEKSQ
jgi:two-component system, OmpR family, sensor kinase